MPERTFLAESYIPGLRQSEFRALAERLTEATAAMRAEGHHIRWLRSLAILEDETCLCIFWSDNVATVEKANRRAEVEYERIVPAIVLDGDHD